MRHTDQDPAPDEQTARSPAGLAAELSHDLLVPLSSVIASLDMLEEELTDRLDPGVAEHLHRALGAGERMVRMLERNMVRHTAGEPARAPETDLADVVRALVADSADRLEPVGAVVEACGLPVVRADPDEMYSVLQNLVDNAVKCARPGVPARVLITARPSGDGWRVSVRDNGVGLPDEPGLDVFSPFSRGSDAAPGHGIGLATVARVVATYGGRVGTTAAGTGAEIWFELPGRAARPGRLSAPVGSAADGAAPSAAGSPGRAER